MLEIGGNQKFISIADGDTITIFTGKTQYKIRLYGNDTPEKGQPFGKAAKYRLFRGCVYRRLDSVVVSFNVPNEFPKLISEHNLELSRLS